MVITRRLKSGEGVIKRKWVNSLTLLNIFLYHKINKLFRVSNFIFTHMFGIGFKKKYQITKEKELDLKEELKKLVEVDLVDAKNRMEESRENDSDEDDASLGIIADEKNSIEKRIKEIRDILSNYEIIKEKEVCEPNQIKIGSKVKVKDGDKVMEYKIVSSIEADPTKNYISEDSPLGKKLLKAKNGDTVKVWVRHRLIKYEILEVC